MNTFARAIAIVAFFGIVSPVLGFALFIGLEAMRANEHDLFVNLSDFLESIKDFGLPAAGSGVLFTAIIYGGLGAWRALSSLFFRSALAAICLLLVFGVPFVVRLVNHHQASALFGLVAGIAAVVGFIIGGVYPKQLLPRRHQNAS
jgi:hypothetical protein